MIPLVSNKKWSLKKFKQKFSVVFRAFDLECLIQTYLKAAFVMFDLVSMKFRKLESIHRKKQENLISIKRGWSH